jgi:hypothetical protein
MKRNLKSLFSALSLIGLSVAATTPEALAADPLGYAAPLGWAGSGARINIFNPTFTNMESELSPLANVPTYVEHGDYMDMEDVYGWSGSSAYVLKGHIRAAGTADEWQAGGYFRDELYFATANGQPAELAFTFSVVAYGSVGPGGFAQLNLGWNVPVAPLTTPTDWHFLSNKMLIDTTTEGSFSTTTTVTLKSTDWVPEYLVQSGSYLPISVSLWGSVKEASLYWGNTVQLLSVQAYQGGVALDASDFTILSQNNEVYFDTFAHGTAPIPEPETWVMLLAGLGLVSLTINRHRS